jgi:outer membrane cobalamin receptor
MGAEPPAKAPAPGPTEKSPAPAVTEIVVTGERTAVENTIDRKIYAVSQDLQAAAGSAADVLRNLPSVTVDMDGNPSLRGDSSITILGDGRMAPEFNGANRGSALQQLGASNIDRIEVLTNPPANFKRDGAGGIINIITKRRSGTRSASAHAGLGSNGRYNVGGSSGSQLGKVQLRGSASLRHDQRRRDIQDDRITFDESGVAIDNRDTHSIGDDARLSKNVSVSADLDVTDIDRLTAEGSFYRRDADSLVGEHAPCMWHASSMSGTA